MKAKDWLEKAKREKFALGAFNVGNLEILKAIVAAASSLKSPIIVESSPGETSWLGADNLVDLAQNFSQEYQIPIFVNLDHGGSLEECQKGIEAGYDLIHFDGSKLSMAENIRITKKVVNVAHQKNLLVEGEIDHIAGSSEVHYGSAQEAISKISMTDPEQAANFIKSTGVDIFAAFFGNVHGIYSKGDEKLDLELFTKITQKVEVFFSLHGGSGITDKDIKQAIERGIVKININTEIRQIYKEQLSQALSQHPDEYALYKIEQPVLDQVQKLIEEKLRLFGSAGQI